MAKVKQKDLIKALKMCEGKKGCYFARCVDKYAGVMPKWGEERGCKI